MVYSLGLRYLVVVLDLEDVICLHTELSSARGAEAGAHGTETGSSLEPEGLLLIPNEKRLLLPVLNLLGRCLLEMDPLNHVTIDDLLSALAERGRVGHGEHEVLWLVEHKVLNESGLDIMSEMISVTLPEQGGPHTTRGGNFLSLTLLRRMSTMPCGSLLVFLLPRPGGRWMIWRLA